LLSLLRARIEINRLAQDWRLWSEAIAKAAEEVLGSSQVYVFGSVAERHATGGSDVDLLIVADRLPENHRARGDLKAKIEETAKLPLYHPFEIHLATRREAESNPIYRKVINEKTGLLVHRVEKRG
jgi:predicted nucleotidyltransferase